MHVKSVRLRNFKRFNDLHIADLPATAKLIILAGPNGSGKSSLFDAFAVKDMQMTSVFLGDDGDTYYLKNRSQGMLWHDMLSVEFHEDIPGDTYLNRKVFYLRSAYRNEPDFTTETLRKHGSVLDGERIRRFIGTDQRVKQNYEMIASRAMGQLFSKENRQVSAGDIADRLIGRVREAMLRVFNDLVLEGPGSPLEDGTFFFGKGPVEGFQYKNLSGGEKAAFDLLLDFVVKREGFNDTVFCIDEPELHLNTRVQARLIEELFALIPDQSQLWIATHSIGMMKKARDLGEQHPDKVIFLDFEQNFDEAVVLTPVEVNRLFWQRTLSVALDELAELVAPRQVVICEGGVAVGKETRNTEFDARCYRKIFQREFPDTEFISLGSSTEVELKGAVAEAVVKTLVSGARVWKVVDRDERTDEEIEDLRKSNVRVLSRRHIEAYLMDEEVLMRLCARANRADKEADVLRLLRTELEKANGNAKDASGPFHSKMRSVLSLPTYGSNAPMFLRDIVAPCVEPGMAVYEQLREDVFGS